MRKKYIIVNKKRFYTFITISLILTIILISFIFSLQRAHSQKQVIYHEYRVGEGDTLWKISNRYLENLDMDIRQFIYEIKKLNGMETSAIYENEIIKIPIIE